MAAPEKGLVPNKPIPNFPRPAIVVDTVVKERRSRYQQNYSPIEPGTPFTPLNHSLDDIARFGSTISLGQKAADDPEFQEATWATLPATQDVDNYDIDYSDDNPAYPIFKRRYLILRDFYGSGSPYGPLAVNSVFLGIFAVYVTAGGTGYTNGAVVTFSGPGFGGSAILVCNAAGTIVKITLKAEGAGYTSAPTVILPGGGTGGSAVAVVQSLDCQLVQEKVIQASELWQSLYLMVERVYETLPGPIRTSYVQDPTNLIPSTVTQQRIPTDEVEEPSAVTGTVTDIKHINAAVSEVTKKEIDLTALGDYYAFLPARGSLNVPRVLLALTVAWIVSEGDGTAAETGSGAATSGSISINSSVHAQCSAAVVPELIPSWATRWTENLPFLDGFVFVGAQNATEAGIITQLSAALSTYFGTAITLNAWPTWGAVESNFALLGEKVSGAAGTTGRLSISIDSGGSAIATASGTENSLDKGPNIRPVNIPLNIHGDLLFGGDSTNSATATAASSTNITLESISQSTTVTASASGSISPVGIYATTPSALPTSGYYLYGLDCTLHESGTIAVRGRIFNFADYPNPVTPTPAPT